MPKPSDKLYNLTGCADVLEIKRARVNQLVASGRFVNLLPVYGANDERVGWVAKESSLKAFKTERAPRKKKFGRKK